jgi:hypothetical protein
MIRNHTIRDEIASIMMEYATLVCAVAETPSTNHSVHKIKFATILELKESATSLIMKKLNEQKSSAVCGSSN